MGAELSPSTLLGAETQLRFSMPTLFESQRQKIHPNKVIWTSFFWTIFVGFRSRERSVLWVFPDFEWVLEPLEKKSMPSCWLAVRTLTTHSLLTKGVKFRGELSKGGGGVYGLSHIYIVMPESYFLYQVFGFQRLDSVPTVLEDLISTAATSKAKVRNCTTGELFSVPLPNSLCGTFSGSLSRYAFPYLGLIVALKKKRHKINWKPDGHIGGTVPGFVKSGCFNF